MICTSCGRLDGWREDIVPRFRWRLYIAGPFLQHVSEGGEIPDGYGIAYYVPGRDVAVVMPLPLNLIVGFVRAALWWLRCPPWRFSDQSIPL